MPYGCVARVDVCGFSKGVIRAGLHILGACVAAVKWAL